MEARAVLWDIDDVLVETAEMYDANRTYAFSAMGLPPEVYSHALACWDRLFWFFDPADVRGILRATLHELGFRNSSAEDKLDAVVESYNDLWWQHVIAASDVVAVARELMERGIPQGIVSNGKKAYQLNKLEKIGALDIFDPTYIIIEPSGSTSAKPNPGGVLHVCSLLGVSPAESIFVGDRSTDVIAANLAGARSLLWQPQTPPKEVRNPPPIPALSIESPTATCTSVRALREYLVR